MWTLDSIMEWAKRRPVLSLFLGIWAVGATYFGVAGLFEFTENPEARAQYAVGSFMALTALAALILGNSIGPAWRSRDPKVSTYAVAGGFAVVGALPVLGVFLSNQGTVEPDQVPSFGALSLIAWPFAVEIEGGSRPSVENYFKYRQWAGRVGTRAAFMVGAVLILMMPSESLYALPVEYSFGLKIFLAFEAAEMIGDVVGLYMNRSREATSG